MNPLIHGHTGVNGYKAQKHQAEHAVVREGVMGPREVVQTRWLFPVATLCLPCNFLALPPLPTQEPGSLGC